MIRTLSIMLLVCAACWSAEWHVSGSGDDAADGTAPLSANGHGPFRTLERAAQVVNPGDTVWILDGTYTNTQAWIGSDLVTLTRSGTAEAWISWKAWPGHRPELRFNGWNAIKVEADYQLIEGLTIIGNNDQVTLSQAEADALLPNPDPRFHGSAVSTDGRGKSAPNHHLVIRRCTISKCGGGGIAIVQSDYLTVEDCWVSECAWYSRYGNSGISIYQAWASDQAAGYHNVIRNNRTWNNRSLVRWFVTNDYTDGNGIIYDDSKHVQNGSQRGAYAARTLISGNLSVNNGGSGMHVYSSEHVDMVGNTAYQNGQVVPYAEIYANDSADVRIIGNIMYARTGGLVNDNYLLVDVTYDYNQCFNGTMKVTGAHDQVGDPLFRAAGLDLPTADFRLQSGSPAIDSGLIISGVTGSIDLVGNTRPGGRGLDRGAYEFVPGLSVVRGRFGLTRQDGGWDASIDTDSNGRIDAVDLRAAVQDAGR